MAGSDKTDRSILTRVPPQNNDAEIAVLCCCLDSQNTITTVASYLAADDFYSPAHQKIYETIYHLYSESKSIDLITVGDELKKQGHDVDRKIITMKDIKKTGDFVALVHFHKEVIVEIPVKVVAENAPVEEKAPVAQAVKRARQIALLPYVTDMMK